MFDPNADTAIFYTGLDDLVESPTADAVAIFDAPTLVCDVDFDPAIDAAHKALRIGRYHRRNPTNG